MTTMGFHHNKKMGFPCHEQINNHLDDGIENALTMEEGVYLSPYPFRDILRKAARCWCPHACFFQEHLSLKRDSWILSDFEILDRYSKLNFK
jgi:hypothetical protein